jgi:hypothetical protein
MPLIALQLRLAIPGPPHPLNWFVGWSLLLAAFLTGIPLGLHFHREDFWGGYNSFRRRLVRLGHIALAALGMVNLLYSLSPWPPPNHWPACVAGFAFAAGGVAMPAVCFLTGWRTGFRHLFFIPVVCLISAVVFTFLGTFTGATP